MPRQNMRVVMVHLPMKRVVAKYIKYMMSAIITGCCIQTAFILTEIAKRLL